MTPMKIGTVRTGAPPLEGSPEGTPNIIIATKGLVEKPEAEWTDDDRLVDVMNEKAAFIITQALDVNAYQQIHECVTAKEIWDVLLEYLEGNDNTKDNKLYDCIQEFDSFKKDPKESLRVAYNRFCEVKNAYANLGKRYSKKNLNMRFLSSLGSAWHIKVTTIKESKDLNEINLQNLYASLKIYERAKRSVEKGTIQLSYISTDPQVADIFTKPLDATRFAFLRGELGMLDISS